MQFRDLEILLQASALQKPKPDLYIKYLLTDSRKSILGDESLFFAISGPNHDGHEFVVDMYRKGCRQFILEKEPQIKLTEANILLVPNVIEALQAMSGEHRKQYSLPVVGVSGSNGKTVVKEWLSQLLSRKKAVVRSPKSYNSQIGVPLSLWQINGNHEIAVIEAGISLPGEMKKLQPLIQPDIGIFTNLGTAHDEGFSDRFHKASEKALLFKEAKQLIYRREYLELDEVLSKKFPPERLISWTSSTDHIADWQVSFDHSRGSKVEIGMSQGGGKQHRFSFQYSDDASIENISHCIIFLLEQEWTSEEIQQGLESLRSVKMRLEMKEGVNRCYLLDDSYSNDLSGLEIALNYLVQQKHTTRHTVILSDLLETGFEKNELYHSLLQLLQAFDLHRLILIGADSEPYQHLFAGQNWYFQHFKSTESFLETLDTSQFEEESILVKGARVFGFERIVMQLQQKIHGTTLEINLDAVTHNLNYYRSLLTKDCRLMVMVKAYSYGGAAFEIANLLQFHGVDYLAVAYPDEGVMLRQKGIRIPILVLNPSPESFHLMVQHNLEPEIYSIHLLKEWLPYANSGVPIHLNMDTGMHRLGFASDELPDLIHFLIAHSELLVKSIFSHLVASEDFNEDQFSHKQVQQYQQMYEQLSSALPNSPLRHVLNSAGIVRFPDYQMDMVRLGLGLYGVDGSKQSNELRPISRLRTVVSQIKEVPAGDSIGYNRIGKVEATKRIATLAIGYADGLDRRLGNGNFKFFINGFAAPTIGNVCMDMTMVDISGIEAQVGDDAIIFGPEQSVQILADSMGTIPYEVLTGISERVKRVYFADS